MLRMRLDGFGSDRLPLLLRAGEVEAGTYDHPMLHA